MSDLAEIKGLLESIRGDLDALNGAPALELEAEKALKVDPAPAGIAQQAVAPQTQRTIMGPAEMMAIRKELKGMDDAELMMAFAIQANKPTGIPLQAWLAAGGETRSAAFDKAYDQEFSPEVQKLLDTSGGSALIRQDLEPVLYELFIREFPAFARFPKEPANGLVHTYQQQLTFGSAQFMGELGTVTDDNSTYQRQTTNIAIVATRRGVSLKNQFAALQSGSGFNPENLELRGGLRSIQKKMQDTIFGGHSTDSGGTANNELGLYDANGFTGLRALLNTGDSFVKNVDPATSPDTTGSIRRAVANASVDIMNYGPGRPRMIYANPLDVETYSQQQEAKQRWVGPSAGIVPGTEAIGVMTPFGAIGFDPIPGNSIPSYTSTQYSSNTVRDMYLLDETSMSLPWLGSEGVTTIEIPMGVSGQLTHLFIFFGMWGLALKAPKYNNKIRVKV